MKKSVLFIIAIALASLTFNAQCNPTNTVGLIVTTTTLITPPNPVVIKICSTGNAYDTTGNSGRVYFLETGAKLTMKLNSTTVIYMKTGSTLTVIGNDNNLISSEPGTTMTGVVNPVTSCSLITFAASPACPATGLNDQNELSNMVAFFPNPAKNNLTFTNESASVFSAQILNALGQNVYSFLIENGRKSYDISDLTEGIYFVSFNDNNKLVSTKKLIITK